MSLIAYAAYLLLSSVLLTDAYQEELCDHFVPGEEFDFYSDYDDLCAKVDYYLSHEKERQDIARAGRIKVQRDFSLSKRLDEMLEMAL